MKKIIYILPHPEVVAPGQSRYWRLTRERRMVQHTRELGHRCELFLLSIGGPVRQADDDVSSWFFPVDDSDKTGRHFYTSTSLLNRIEEERPDLIIFKGMGYKLPRWLIGRSRYRFSYAFIVGGGTRDVLTSRASYVLGETASQIGADFNRHYHEGRAAVLPKLLLPNDFQESFAKDFDIISVGRFTHPKNQKALIPFFLKYRVALIGDGEHYGDIKAHAERHSGNVYLPGNIPREQVLELIARSRLMVHPSTSEGLPRVVVEAFACGVPVVVLRRGIADGFEHAVHGLMVEESELITSVEKLLSDEARLQEMGRRAIEFAKASFSEDAVFRVVDRMYDTVFSARQRAVSLHRLRLEMSFKSGWRALLLRFRALGRRFGLGTLRRSLAASSLGSGLAPRARR